jgi:hypothetical protein
MVLPTASFGHGFDGVRCCAPNLVAGLFQFPPDEFIVYEAQKVVATFPVVVDCVSCGHFDNSSA